MRQETGSWSVFQRFTVLMAIVAAGIITIVGSNGGGGGGGDGDTGSELLATYDISIERGVDGSGTATDGITVTFDGGAASVRVDPNPLLGQYMCDQTTEICELSRINPGTFLYVYDESTPQIVGDLVIQITAQVIIGDSGGMSGIPIIGTIQVQSVAAPAGLDAGFIDVEMATCPGGPGVNIYDNTTLLGCYTWDTFEDLFDTSAVPAEQLASFGFQAISFLFEQVDNVTEVLHLIDQYEDDLEGGVAITEMCDAFSNAGLAAPVGTPDQGMRVLSWIDDNPDGQLGPGDDFEGTITECWVNDPSDDIDEILDGTGNFYNYVENVDQFREVITAIGFTAVAPPNPGGVTYSGFTISETEETSPGTAEITNVIGLTGGVSVLFTEP
jgi:hypothetical protein